MSIWGWVIHVTGADYGLVPGRWSYYGFWSGIGSDFGELTVLAAVLGLFRRHNCHVRGCWRLGRHLLADEAAGVEYRVCARHHPRAPDRGLTRAHLRLVHARDREAA